MRSRLIDLVKIKHSHANINCEIEYTLIMIRPKYRHLLLLPDKRPVLLPTWLFLAPNIPPCCVLFPPKSEPCCCCCCWFWFAPPNIELVFCCPKLDLFWNIPPCIEFCWPAKMPDLADRVRGLSRVYRVKKEYYIKHQVVSII